MREIIKNGIVLARHIPADDLVNGWSFFSEDGEFIQVGAWGYNSGENINPHIHNEFSRTASRTCEMLYVISGALEVDIFDLDKHHVESFAVNKGDALILLECGHGFAITQDNTRVLEVKNGPYFGAKKDRQRF